MFLLLLLFFFMQFFYFKIEFWSNSFVNTNGMSTIWLLHVHNKLKFDKKRKKKQKESNWQKNQNQIRFLQINFRIHFDFMCQRQSTTILLLFSIFFTLSEKKKEAFASNSLGQHERFLFTCYSVQSLLLILRIGNRHKLSVRLMQQWFYEWISVVDIW